MAKLKVFAWSNGLKTYAVATTSRPKALEAWRNKPRPTSALAGEGVMELGKAVLSRGPPQLQTFLVHLATNSIHYRWDSPAAPGAAADPAERSSRA